MNDEFAAAMRRATVSTRALNLSDATRVIQDALAGRSATAEPGPAAPDIIPPAARSRPKPFAVDPHVEIIEPSAKPDPASPQADPSRTRRSLGDTLRILGQGRASTGLFDSLPGAGLPGMARPSTTPVMPEGSQYLARSLTCAAGERRYKLYIPACAPVRPHGLIVMLHGCKQDPDDFMTGTGMNAVAEAHGLMVAYPGQTGADNASSCWNWFRPSDQRRGAGEPAIIAGITQGIIREFDLDPSRIFVAGLSAGGAMAAVMGETYPDLYAAVGIHSGLACGSASDVVSAFSAMRGDVGSASRAKPISTHRVRTIVFQGDADSTVHSSNAARIVSAATPSDGTVGREAGRSAGGRTYERTIVTDETGRPAVECWLVNGAGHAWSGGNAGGSFTDPRGPDATTEMVRFFLDQPESRS